MTSALSSCSGEIFVEPSGDSAQDHRCLAFIRQGLKKIFPVQSFWIEKEDFSFPKVKILSSYPLRCSVLLVCPFHLGVEKFFYEMISKWLSPGRCIAVHSFFYYTFFFSSDREKRFSFCEIQIPCRNEQEQEDLVLCFAQIERELLLGSLSLYQGNRILEMRGQSFSAKNSLIQERIGILLRRRPQDFDYDLFGQMQHFLVTCRDDFKQVREISHLNRIVYVFYLFRRFLRKEAEKKQGERHVSFKVNRVRLHSPFGVKKVLGIFVGFTIFKRHEVFEEKHLLQAIREYVPTAQFIEGSKFVYYQKEEQIQILYLEVEKESGEAIFCEEIQNLRRNLPFVLENQVESLVPNVFMPRNEEEVLKNIILLSHQLKYIKDIPQVLISFEEQTDLELSFTVILLRVLLQETEPSIKQLFLSSGSLCVFVEDRIKQVGFIRGKYKKEASVFRLKVPKFLYVRRDHSVDLLKARQAIVQEIHRAVGEFRDYNGGMIAKHIENLQIFKKFFPQERDSDLEGFFQDIFPAEIRGVIDPFLLKILYEFWVKAPQSRSIVFEKGSIVFLIPYVRSVEDLIKSLGLSSSQMLFFSSKKNGVAYFGSILSGLSQERAEFLMQSIVRLV